MANYQVVNGVPKGAGADLYAEAMETQKAHDEANIAQAKVFQKIIAVSNKPTRRARAFQWYATKDDLINLRGFPTVNGIPTPVTKEQAMQEGYADSPDYRVSRKGKYHKFWTSTYNNFSRQTASDVLARQAIYRAKTGKSTFAYHGCDGHMCPQWSKNTGKLLSNVKTHQSRKKINALVETSKTMYQGISRKAYHLQPDLAPPVITPKPEPKLEPKPEPVETRNYAGLIVGIGIIAVIIFILFRRRK